MNHEYCYNNFVYRPSDTRVYTTSQLYNQGFVYIQELAGACSEVAANTSRLSYQTKHVDLMLLDCNITATHTDKHMVGSSTQLVFLVLHSSPSRETSWPIKKFSM